MVTLWVLFVKCKAQEITKEAILCKYSRHSPCFASANVCKPAAGLGEFSFWGLGCSATPVGVLFAEHCLRGSVHWPMLGETWWHSSCGALSKAFARVIHPGLAHPTSLTSCTSWCMSSVGGATESSYLLGLLAMIKCSICSYQCDNWYVSNWRLASH